MPSKTTIIWYRNDLRLADHPALAEAAEEGAVVPVFVWAPEEEGAWAPGGAHAWWLHHSLEALAESFADRGSRLTIRRGPSLEALRAVAEATGADAVAWLRRYAPPLARRDDEVAEALRDDGLDVKVYASRILHEPGAVRTTTGGPYHVYTPFWKKLRKKDELLHTGEPVPAPSLGDDAAPSAWPDTLAVDDLGLLPEARDGVDWAEGLRAMWTPGEAAAHERLQYTLDHVVEDYEETRNRPDLDGTSRLSPRLHHGELSPRQVWHAVEGWQEAGGSWRAAKPFLQELVWREFSYHMLVHYPETPTETYEDKFKDFRWEDDADALQRWQDGQTGYPIVDAGMRQLYETGWMHNRVRMIVGSFLTKDLFVPWQDGARWFWDCLVDGDLASNTMGWQWSAGSGADAQPFFRIFNPVSQSERFDPEGAYIRRFVPEIADLPTKHLHAPWDAPEDVLAEAGVTLGETYPHPMVQHGDAREEAMARYDEIR